MAAALGFVMSVRRSRAWHSAPERQQAMSARIADHGRFIAVRPNISAVSSKVGNAGVSTLPELL
jgi:hypothetical protein